VSQASPLFSRTLTVIAAAVLAFDGAALAALGWWGRRPMLVLIGMVFFVSSGLVFLYWRWYRKRMKDIASARSELAEEARELQRVLRESKR
jgi:uncharacterized membrane protein